MGWITISFILIILANDILLIDGTNTQMVIDIFARLGLIASLFILALQNKDCGAGSYAEALGKDLSGNIYYWHGAIITLTAYLLQGTALEDWIALPVFVVTTLLAYLIMKSQRTLGINLLP